MHSLIISLAVTGCLIMGALGDEPVEPLSANAPASDPKSFILRILNAVETHDYRTLLDYTLGEAIDYFGHKNSTNTYVEQDMTQDARTYRWCRFGPDLGTFQTSLGHDSIEYDSDAMDVRGKEHKARCRLDIYYTPTPSPRLQALSLKVLPSHAATGNSRPTVSGPAAGQDEQSGYEKAIAQGTKIIKTKVIPHYETKDGFSVKPLDIKYENDPTVAEQIKGYGSIWKRLDPVVSDAYTSIQRQVNDKNKPEASSYRVLLADAFSEAVELRGGGSGSGQLLTFAPAHEEWIIAHLGTAQEDDLSDEVFVSRLRKSLTVGESPERHRVQAVLEKLKAVERFLKASEAAFLRQEFLAYFER
jgi:hypothetical protein